MKDMILRSLPAPIPLKTAWGKIGTLQIQALSGWFCHCFICLSEKKPGCSIQSLLHHRAHRRRRYIEPFSEDEKGDVFLTAHLFSSQCPVFFRSPVGLGYLSLTGLWISFKGSSLKWSYYSKVSLRGIGIHACLSNLYFFSHEKARNTSGISLLIMVPLQIYEVLIRCFPQLVCLLRFGLRTYQRISCKDK